MIKIVNTYKSYINIIIRLIQLLFKILKNYSLF